MNLKKNFIKIAIFIVVLAANNSLFGVYVHNNSIWNIKYKLAPANNDVPSHREQILYPDQTIKVDGPPLSIRRSGLGSSVVSAWTNVPLTTDHDAVIEIGSGWQGNNWNFQTTKHVQIR